MADGFIVFGLWFVVCGLRFFGGECHAGAEDDESMAGCLHLVYNGPVIHVDQLSKTFVSKKSPSGWLGWTKPKVETSFEAVKDLSFQAQPGEFFALLGPNGAGKTTTLKMLSGILHPSSGYIDVFGHQPFRKTIEFKKLISFVMAQKSQLFLELPVRDTFDFMAAIYGVEPRQYRTLLRELVERFELTDKLETVGRRLSLGQRMKCELVCSFIYQPKVVFLDEPTIGLDVNSAQEVRTFLRQTNKELGTTIILTTHNMQDVEELCERTIVINHGRAMFDGATQELKRTFGDLREIEFIFESKGMPVAARKRLVDQLADFGGEIIEQSPLGLRVRTERKQSTDVINLVMLQANVAEINFAEEDLSQVMGRLYKQELGDEPAD